MPYFKKLIGKKCYLSPCSITDAQKYTGWVNDLEVAIPMGAEAYQTIPLQKEEELLKHDISKQTHLYNIITTEEDKLVGRCVLLNIDHLNRRANVAIVIGEKRCWNKGFGREALRLLLDYGFNLLNLNNVMLTTGAFNKRAIACYKKVGFKEIGIRRKARILCGKKYDLIFMDLLAEEFKSDFVARLIEQ